MNQEHAKSIERLENSSAATRVIELRSVYKNGKTTVMPTPDGMGWYLGVPRLSEQDKRSMIYWAEPDSKVVLKHGIRFDLSDPAQAVTWSWVKFSAAIAASEAACQMTPGAEFYVHEDSVEFVKSITAKEQKFKAGNLVLNDPISNHGHRALLLGVDMEGSTPGAIKDFLLEMADKAPSKILEVFESRDISTKLLLLKAMKNNVIIKDPNGIYYYGNVTLGTSEKSAIHWLNNTENKHMVDLLEKEVNPDYFVEAETIKPNNVVEPINEGTVNEITNPLVDKNDDDKE